MIKETGKIIKEVARVCDFCNSTNLHIGFKSHCNICRKDICDSHSICIGEYTFCTECNHKHQKIVSDAAYAKLLDETLETYIFDEQLKIDNLKSDVWDQIKKIRAKDTEI